MSQGDAALLAAFRQVSLFSMLDEDGTHRMAAIAKPRRYEAGETLIEEGEEGDELFVIVSGHAVVCVDDLGDSREVARLSGGDFFGEMAIMGNHTRQATIVATSPMYVLAFAAAELLQLIAAYPHLNEVLTAVGIKRSEENMERMFSGE